MVHALVDISDKANRILNVIKAKYGLNDKSAAIEKMAEEYEHEILEPAFKPEFVSKVQASRRGPFRKIKNLDDILKKT